MLAGYDRLRSAVLRQRRDISGNVAVSLSLALMPLLGMAGAAVDYARLVNEQSVLGNAVDSAALAAARDIDATLARRTAIAKRYLDANVAARDALAGYTMQLSELKGQGGEVTGLRLTATAKVPNHFLTIIGFETTDIASTAEVPVVSMPIEVALVIDNTGSMSADMPALKTAAAGFINSLIQAENSDAVRIALVPYVGAVNPGRNVLGMSMMDTGAQSPFHGYALRSQWIAAMPFPACNPDPNPVGGASAPPSPPDNPGGGKDKRAGAPSNWNLAAILGEIFGFGAAQAQVTPSFSLAGPGQSFSPGLPYGTTSAWVPNGFSGFRCYLVSPDRISHFDLFNRTIGPGGLPVQWKGCVEARPAPYDVTDDPPSIGSPSSLFVPYFWPDEPDPSPLGNWSGYDNNYLPDGRFPAGWEPLADNLQMWFRANNVFKYDSLTRAAIADTPPATKGPNRACPDAVVPLTSSKATLNAAISALSHWEGSGTVSSEGLAWGWRAISPNLPFANGRLYGKAQKYIVLMSDGLNSVAPSYVDGPFKSDYTAYGVLRAGQYGTDRFDDAARFLNRRLLDACSNAKAKGIKIMTVLYREDNATAQSTMQQCASTPSHSYLAKNASDLAQAFEKVSGEIGSARMAK